MKRTQSNRVGLLSASMAMAVSMAMAMAVFAGPQTADGGAPSATQILERADAAIKAVHAVSYQVESEPAGSAIGRISGGKGEGAMFGWDGGGPEKFYARIKTTRRDSDEVVELEGGGDGESFFLIDHGTKKAYEDIDPLVLGSNGNILRGMGMLEFVHNAPFDDELGAEKSEVLGTEKIHGEECYKVHVLYSGDLESTWFFSTEDYLPRRRIRHITDREGNRGTITITISDLVIDPQANPALFKLVLPEGYEQIDDFAP